MPLNVNQLPLKRTLTRKRSGSCASVAVQKRASGRSLDDLLEADFGERHVLLAKTTPLVECPPSDNFRIAGDPPAIDGSHLLSSMFWTTVFGTFRTHSAAVLKAAELCTMLSWVSPSMTTVSPW